MPFSSLSLRWNAVDPAVDNVAVVLDSESLQARTLAVASHEMGFSEAFSWLIQDELDSRRSQLLERHYTLSRLDERKELKEFD